MLSGNIIVIPRELLKFKVLFNISVHNTEWVSNVKPLSYQSVSILKNTNPRSVNVRRSKDRWSFIFKER
ncbi:hypothetical protein C1H46_004892 [Malus baccata]|uniref:Uncharacterized protein n=1 Tax=Malus baccata TaxID=106549 RepID=A0A540NER6_MALBA|nr:hypothetical protein C1H46_004892 [Malus baccata]